MIAFRDDYSDGAHPDILAAIIKGNNEYQTSYADDDYTASAQKLIRQKMNSSDAAVHFVPSGTLANIIAIASCLRPHEAVIAASSGHIVARETGAIEATGHKTILVKPIAGKLTPDSIIKAIDENSHFPHMAKPRLVYISNATEVGTIYRKAELIELSNLCRSRGLLLYLDGARLGAALAAELNDVTLEDLSHQTDIFWIGGTKNGALLGEAIVIPNSSLREDFLFHVKQRGGLLAKGRVLGIQFQEFFRENLFFELASHANKMAQALSAGIMEAGCELVDKTETNQVFPILPDPLIAHLQKGFSFYVWTSLGNGKSVIRLITSWSTTIEQVQSFIQDLKHSMKPEAKVL